MDGTVAFSSRVENYARHRWDYAPLAIEALNLIRPIFPKTCIADIGSGTGTLTRHFLGKAQRVYAVEPNPEMRQVADEALSLDPAYRSVDGRAEATRLPDDSVDLIAVGQAIHWFEPDATRPEFLRIARPNCWLATLRNYPVDSELSRAAQAVYTEANGAIPPERVERPEARPMRFYYGHDQYVKLSFLFESKQTWEAFLGAALSAAYAPTEDDPRYPNFERDLRNVFDRFSTNGMAAMQGITELHAGPIVGL